MKERGGSRIKLVIGLAITAALILGAVRVVPVYVRSYEFQDAMRSQAKFAGVENKPAERIREELYRKAQSLNLPLRRDQIQVSPRGLGVAISARYTVPVDLVLFTHNLNFNYSADTATAF